MAKRPDESSSKFIPVHVQSTSAADEIVGQLHHALIRGTLRPGDRLAAEPELAIDFGVSRSTVREAIRMLRTQGMLRTIRGAKGGHFIASPQTHAVAESVGDTYGLWFEAGDISIAEIDEARHVVEGACVRLACERRDTDDVVRMQDILRLAADRTLPIAQFLDLDVQFHTAIARAARNRLLELPLTAIHMVRPRTNLLLRRHSRRSVLAQHRRICAAIEARDPVAAELAFEEHVASLAKERAAALKSRTRPATEIAVRTIPATVLDPVAE